MWTIGLIGPPFGLALGGFFFFGTGLAGFRSMKTPGMREWVDSVTYGLAPKPSGEVVPPFATRRGHRFGLVRAYATRQGLYQAKNRWIFTGIGLACWAAAITLALV